MPGAAFNEAAEASKKLNAKPNTDELLQVRFLTPRPRLKMGNIHPLQARSLTVATIV